MISSELPEVIGICDRVLVMREGHIEGEVGGPQRHADHPGEHHGARDRRGGLSGGKAGRRGGDTWQRPIRPQPRGGAGQGVGAAACRCAAMIQALGMLPVLISGLHRLPAVCPTDRFFTPQNISIVTQQASINTVLAAGMTFVILTGGIDLSVGSMLAAVGHGRR